MPFVENGPPQWVWERPAERLRWEIVAVERPDGIEYELKANCGLEILRIQFLTREDVQELATATAKPIAQHSSVRSARNDRGMPSGGAGREDRTGIIGEGVRIDPSVTEGHPGYEESGSSEMKIC